MIVHIQITTPNCYSLPRKTEVISRSVNFSFFFLFVYALMGLLLSIGEQMKSDCRVTGTGLKKVERSYE